MPSSTARCQPRLGLGCACGSRGSFSGDRSHGGGWPAWRDPLFVQVVRRHVRFAMAEASLLTRGTPRRRGIDARTPQSIYRPHRFWFCWLSKDSCRTLAGRKTLRGWNMIRSQAAFGEREYVHTFQTSCPAKAKTSASMLLLSPRRVVYPERKPPARIELR